MSTLALTRGRLLVARVSRSAALMATLCCAGCMPRPEAGYLSPVAQAGFEAPTHEHTLFVATTRQRDARPGTLFNGERASPLDFAAITVDVPPNHVAGAIEWPTTPPGNPQTDFVVREADYVESDARFLKALNAQLARRPPGKRHVLLFIHGYNTLFAEGLYRLAQVTHDSGARAVPVLFSWASRGRAAEYVYDNNSATAARDDLERTIRLLCRSNAEKIDILAHSMGNWVTVEAFRQIRMSGKELPTAKMGNVILAAPDIDIDVFKSQIRRFGKPAKPYVIVLSKDDKALRLSTLIAGGQSRLGADSNTAELTELGAIVVDLTDLKATDASNHSKFAQLAAIAPQLDAVLSRGIGTGDAATGQTGDAIGRTLGDMAGLPIKIIGAPTRTVSAQ